MESIVVLLTRRNVRGTQLANHSGPSVAMIVPRLLPIILSLAPLIPRSRVRDRYVDDCVAYAHEPAAT